MSQETTECPDALLFPSSLVFLQFDNKSVFPVSAFCLALHQIKQPLIFKAGEVPGVLTLTVLVTTVNALQRFETG